VIDFGLEHPEMVSVLVLVGSGVSGLNDRSQLSAETVKYITELSTAARDCEVDKAREIEAKYWIDGPRRDASRVDPVYRNRARQLHRENFKLQRFATQEDQLKTPAIGRLGEISVPTLVVIGDEDEKDLARLADKLAAEVPGATKTENAKAAHLPSLEHPPLFDQILSDFLAR